MALPEPIEGMLRPHLARTLIVDANLLLLLLLGGTDGSRIGKGRLSRFEFRDFAALAEMWSRFPRQMTTPHILCQVSDLARHDVRGEAVARWCQAMVRFGAEAEEIHFPLSRIDVPVFLRLGLADAGLLQAATINQALLVSVDHELCGQVVRRKGAAINFNHVSDMLYG